MTQTRPIDVAIDSAIHDRRIVGAVVLLSEDGVPIYRRAAGLADREAGRQMRIEDRFRYASVTKLFTTAAALKLIQAGRLDPSAPITETLPDFRPAAPDGSRPAITVDQLMSHTAGLDYDFQQPVDGPYHRAGISNGLDDQPATEAQNLARLAQQPLIAPPGTKWHYSMATDVLGAAIGAIHGGGFSAAIADLVTGPLGLDASFLASAADLVPTYRDATPEPERFDQPTQISFGEGAVLRMDPRRITRDDGAFASGGGGMQGDAISALTLIEALRDGPFLPDDLRRQAMALRTRPDDATRGPGWGFSWLGSLLTDPAAAGTALPKGTIAWGGVYGHSWLTSPETGRSMIGLTNTTLEGMFGRFARELAEATARRI